MTERDYRAHPEQPERSPEEMDGTNLLPDSLKERMPPLYSQENEPDPMVDVNFLIPLVPGRGTQLRGHQSMRTGITTPTRKRLTICFSAMLSGLSRNSGIFP